MLKEEHRLLRESLREFAQARLAPFAAEWDRRHLFPQDTLHELAQLGAFGIAVPQEWGGAGMDYTALAIALEEIAAGDGGVSTIISVNNCPVCAILMGFASPEQKERFLKPLASG
ncbi:MAG: acyl-CoA dehydrogenase family protein, partial [Burkholderiaceae bacterium]|nr:acyl-CoA dehydrogenase family protein [Burkholderiaceae bacterium]